MISIVFLRKWEVMGAPARPPKIVENVMSNHFPFQEFFYRNLQYLVIPRFKNVSHYSYFSGTFADSCRVVQLYSDHGKSTRHKVLAQVPGTRFSLPPRHKVPAPRPAQGPGAPPGTRSAQGFGRPGPGAKASHEQPCSYVAMWLYGYVTMWLCG